MSEMQALAEELREYTAMKYAGDCKCGKCQLVPRALVERIYHTLNGSSVRCSAVSAEPHYPSKLAQFYDAELANVTGQLFDALNEIKRLRTEPQSAPIGYVSQATLRLLSERGQAGHICPVPAYDTLIPVYAGPAQQSQAESAK